MGVQVALKEDNRGDAVDSRLPVSYRDALPTKRLGGCRAGQSLVNECNGQLGASPQIITEFPRPIGLASGFTA